MIHRYILHLEAHRRFWPRVSLRRAPRVGDVTPDGVLIGCPTCSTSGFLALDPLARQSRETVRATLGLPLHRTEAGYPRCATCDGGGCYDCTDPS